MLDRSALASVGRRAAGALADMVVLAVVVVLYGLVVAAIWPDDARDPYTSTEQVGGLVLLIGVIVLPIVYGALFTRFGACTPGQRLTGTRTLSLVTPGSLSTLSAFHRAGVWCFGGWCAGFGLWGAGRNELSQAWHDEVVDTVVVRADAYAAVVEALRAAPVRPAGPEARRLSPTL
jgi:uncharacterized RDD family membrane protein YckC